MAEGKQPTGAEVIIAIDPGQEKCGLALLRFTGEVVFQDVVARHRLAEEVRRLHQAHHPRVIVVGDRTGAREVVPLLEELHLATPVQLVDEHRSSEEGRRRYFAANPPRGWRRLLPRGLLTPGRPHDDYVAIILGERYLEADRAQECGAR